MDFSTYKADEIAIGAITILTQSALTIAQLETISPLSGGTIMNLLSQFGGLGLAVWLVIRHTTVTIPALQKEHREEREVAAKVHAEVIQKLVLAHNEELDRRRAEFTSILEKTSCNYIHKRE